MKAVSYYVVIEKIKVLLKITILSIFLKSYKNRNEIRNRKLRIKNDLSVTV